MPKDDLAPVSAGMSEEDQAEMNALADELEEVVIQLESKCSEVEEWKANFESLQVDCAERTSELENLNSQLQKAKHDGNTAVEKLKKSEDDLAQIKEKNAQLSDELLSKSRQIAAIENGGQKGAIRKTSLPAAPAAAAMMNHGSESKLVADLRKQIADLEQKAASGTKKKSVKFAETVIADDKVTSLEKALEDAARERQEILEAAEREIEYHRSIAAELETTMIEDFEWKLHEIEADYNRKLKDQKSEVPASVAAPSRKTSTMSLPCGDNDAFERRLREAKNEIIRQEGRGNWPKCTSRSGKRWMDKLRLERNSLKTALDAAHDEDRQKAVEAARKEWSKGSQTSEKKLLEERETFRSDIAKLRKQLRDKDAEMVNAVNDARREGDQKVRTRVTVKRITKYHSLISTPI